MERALFYILFFTWVVLRYWDVRYSLEFPYYGQSEANPLVRNRYGYVDIFRMMLFIAGSIAAMFIVLYFEPAWAWLAPGLASIVTFIIITQHWKSRRNIREKQIAFLSKLRAIPLDEEVTIGMRLYTRHDMHFFAYFGWIYELSPSPEIAKTPEEIARVSRILARRLHELAHQPEEEWFPR
jgi:hypothetical protein